MDLVILVEGDHDVDLFRRIIKPDILRRQQYIPTIWPYSEEPKANTIALLAKMLRNGEAFVLVVDNDKTKCITLRKDIARHTYGTLPNENIIVVEQEIEAWYAAGLSDSGAETLRLTPPRNTDNFTKPQFERWMRPRYTKMSICKAALLRYFSPVKARQRNNSFEYFYSRFC